MTMMISARSMRTVAGLGLAAALFGGCANSKANAPAEVSPESTQMPVTVLPHPGLAKTGTAGSASIADIAERALPSVVNISMTKLSKVQGQGSPFPFFPFFGPGPDQQDRREQHGMGSGVIVSADGYIITNNHVVSEAKEIKVTTHDKREFDATVVGTDPRSDLAVIKIKGDPTGIKPVEFGQSSRLRLGDVVLAIGNPFGVGQTVTMGIVSAKGRADLGIVDYEDFIQTDAAINPGNSGGALIDMEGRLVGINTAILSRSGGYQGIGFAIPSEMAQPIMQALKKDGRVTRGWLGVSIQDIDQELSQALKLPGTSGILISDVKSGTPAAKAGLRRGDVVTKVDGKPVTSSGHFRNKVAAAGSGKKLKLELLRDGKSVALDVELEAMPDSDGAVAGQNTVNGSGALEGLTLEEITPNARRAFGIPGEISQGVVVVKMDPRSPAARAGLRPGDVIIEVNRTAVPNVERLKEVYAKSKNNLLLLVNRRGSTLFVVVRG